jgi:hypothetical protein
MTETPYKPYYRQIDDPVARHSRALIAILEKRIQEEFDMAIRVGYEKELLLHFDKKGKARGKNDQIGEIIEGYRARKVYSMDPALSDHDHRKIMAQFHHEENIDLYEFKTQPAHPSRALTRIDGQVQMVERFGRDYRTLLSPDERKKIDPLRDQIQHEVGVRLEDVSFRPYQKVVAEKVVSEVPAGLHVNFSLWDKQGRNLMHSANDPEIARVQAIRKKLYEYMRSDLLLLAPDDDALKRLRIFKGLKGESGFCELRSPGHGRQQRSKRVEDPDKSRLEFRTPAANARHDLATLMVLAAIYQTLQENDQRRSETMPAIDIKDLATVRQSFEQSSRLIGDLRLIAASDDTMRKHVDQLRTEVLKEVRAHKLHQPTLAELHSKGR